jgi:ATP synthase protein I
MPIDDDLDRLEHQVLARLREREQAEQAARRHSRHLEVQVLRELIAPRREPLPPWAHRESEAPPRRCRPPPGPSRGRPCCRPRSARPARRGARRAGEPTLLRQLSAVGVLGWLIVPMLGGLALGRWLDQRLGSGITFSAALLLLGLGLGAWAGWRWIHKP